MFSLNDESADAHTPSTARTIHWPRAGHIKACFVPFFPSVYKLRNCLIIKDKKIILECLIKLTEDGYPNFAVTFRTERRPFVGLMAPFFVVDKYKSGFHSEVQANVCAQVSRSL